MQIHSLETFFWVYRLSSFRRAAERLNISQPTVSSRIRGLEDELGVTLLHRDRNLTLTEQGRELLDYAQKILRLTDDLSFRQGAVPVETRLRIGANGAVAATWLMALAARLEATQPDLRLEIEVNQSANLLHHLLTDQLELAFLSEEATDSRLRLERLGTYPMVWVARPGLYPAVISDAQLGAYPIISYGWQSPVHDHTYAPAFGQVRNRRFLYTDDLFMMIRLAVDGAGLALLPKTAIAAELSAHKLAVIRVETHPMDLPILVARSRMKRNALADQALDIAKDLMRHATSYPESGSRRVSDKDR
ncbi:LysR family transcriptional regulator [Roseicitreum antarcticum]|uniref:DNA-binding transcriptional regulator, LysR family n=1 Tax=Roseicitreum antarcticum TaxID=564137 RepID=A0A1H2Z5V2_9RHOB|nr:LysR family transcriptional regulator [Roseicitreum antarcticum]SDX12736.1 DNA-binding transcriptional regulator, LysR family [Roseicitreum antarcticum]